MTSYMDKSMLAADTFFWPYNYAYFNKTKHTLLSEETNYAHKFIASYNMFSFAIGFHTVLILLFFQI